LTWLQIRLLQMLGVAKAVKVARTDAVLNEVEKQAA
jgi:hypothetical protein